MPLTFAMLRWAGILTRLVLLGPIIAARTDCGAVAGTAVESRSGHAQEADCHHSDSPAPAPAGHHDGGPAGGHCPAFHSCVLDFAFFGSLRPSGTGFTDVLPDSDSAALPRLDQLPPVPPPRV